MQRQVYAASWATLVALLSTSCQSALGAGMDAFDHANYPHAARELRRAAAEGVVQDDAPRYNLYTGLTHLALGDAERASIHLTRAHAAMVSSPTHFTKSERASLLSAWRALGRMPGQPLEM
jgi:hypothetical protein